MRDLCRLIGWMVVDLIRSRVMLEAEILDVAAADQRSAAYCSKETLVLRRRPNDIRWSLSVVPSHVLEFLHHDADVVVELRHAGLMDGPAVLGVAQCFVLRRQMGDDVHAGRVEPQEERLVVGLGLVDELQGKVADFVVHGFHPLGI